MKTVDELLARVREATPGPNDLQRASMRAAIRRAIETGTAPEAAAPAPAGKVWSGRTIVGAIAAATIAAAALLWVWPRAAGVTPAEPVVHAPSFDAAVPRPRPGGAPGREDGRAAGGDTTSAPPPASASEPTPPAIEKRRLTVTEYGARFAPDVDDLYDRAEAALAVGDRPAARAALEELVLRAPTSPRADVARLDLARLALHMGDPGTTRRHAEALAAGAREPALREAGHHLLCRVAEDPRACAADFLRAFPSSTRAAEMLALEASLTADPCAARPLLRAYVDRFPDGAYAATARSRLATDTCAGP